MSAPPLPMGAGKIQVADAGKFLRDFLHDAERVVRAAVEHDDDLEFAGYSS